MGLPELVWLVNCYLICLYWLVGAVNRVFDRVLFCLGKVYLFKEGGRVVYLWVGLCLVG